MSIFSAIKGLFSKPAAAAAEPTQVYEVVPHSVSRFGLVAPHRGNREHWAGAHNNSINNDLLLQLPALQARCAYEYGTNPDFEGVVNTYKDDVVGRSGPLMQVMSDDERFNESLEAAWREVFADPDPSHRYGGVEDMRTWVHGLMLAGSYVNVQTPVDRPHSQIKFGWRSIHPRRLVTPLELTGDPLVAFGCRYDAVTGAAKEYYVARDQPPGGVTVQPGDFDTIPAAAVQRCYIPAEPEQLTGYPMMSSAPDTAADIRDLDKFVLESIKNSAANSPNLQMSRPDLALDPDPIPTGSIRYEPAQASVAPGGWEWATVDSVHPTSQYIPFKHEKAAELGRPIHMPLLVVLLTAAEANFSSAQYEGAVYADGIGGTQGFIERRSLIPLVMHGLVPEVLFKFGLQMPKVVELVFTWNVPAHANLEKQVKAIRMMIEDGIIAPSTGAAMLGQDWEKVVAARKKCAEALEAAGLPPSPINTGSSLPAAPADDDDDSETKPSEGRKSASRFIFQ